MIYTKKNLFLVFSSILLILGGFFIQSCVEDFETQYKPDKPFDQENAKAWYENVFVNTPEFKSSNEKKHPNFEYGVTKKVGDLEIVEFPLVNVNSILNCL